MRLRNLLYASAFSFLTLLGCGKKESPTQPAVNHPPVIERIVSNPEEPFTGRTVNLECIARDEDNDPLYYDWDKSGGSFSGFNNERIIWHAPMETGRYDINVWVDDRRENGKVLGNKSINVVSRFDTLYAVKDAYIRLYHDPFNDEKRYNTENYGDLNELIVSYNTYGISDYQVYRSFLEFDFSERSSGAEILFANLFLYGEARDQEIDVEVRKVSSSWRQNTITWDNQPIFSSEFTDIQTISRDREGWSVWDITNLVKDWVDETYPNFGIVLKCSEDSPYKSYYMYSSEETNNPERRPKLILKY